MLGKWIAEFAQYLQDAERSPATIAGYTIDLVGFSKVVGSGKGTDCKWTDIGVLIGLQAISMR